jgi:hypothetical protein
MHVVLQPSPSVTHKLRVTLPNQRSIDFGDRGVQHYIDHGNPKLMRAHLIRKGAIIPKELRIETDPYEIQREMLKIKRSNQEDWDDYFTEEYWERWLLWSYPTLTKAKLFMTMRHGMLFMPTPEAMWFCEQKNKY